MSGHQNRIETGPAFATSSDLDAQIARNQTVHAQWQQDRLIEARGVLADFAHHPDSLVVLACRVICTHGSNSIELADALGVSWLLGKNGPECLSSALKGGAA